MLAALTIENWLSFNGRETFDLTASKERTNSETLAKLPAMYGTKKILPLAAIYGANASGKTNLIEALEFMQYLVVNGTSVDRSIPVIPYRLSPECKYKPSLFEVELLIEDRLYVYGFSITRERVVEEHLSIRRTRGLEPIFTRNGTAFNFGTHFNTPRNNFIAEGTRDNQLFLHNAISQNADEFRPVYDWFDDQLEVVGIEAQYGAFCMMLLRDDFKDFINARLKRYGTGISELYFQDVQKESLNVPSDFLEDCLAGMAKDGAKYAQLQTNAPNGPEIFIINAEYDEPRFQKVQLAHTDSDGNTVLFDFAQESSGTQRLVKLLPLFFMLATNDDKTYVVDELDRSFHTALTFDLIKQFLVGCDATTRKQLIFTTHDLLLMQNKDIRRDEQWVAENYNGVGTKLVCIGSHKGVRVDTSLLTAYQNGVFGGYPLFD